MEMRVFGQFLGYPTSPLHLIITIPRHPNKGEAQTNVPHHRAEKKHTNNLTWPLANPSLSIFLLPLETPKKKSGFLSFNFHLLPFIYIGFCRNGDE